MNDNPDTTKRKPRAWRKITPSDVALFNAVKSTEGNGSAAVRNIYGTQLSVKDRAWRLTKKSESETPMQYIDDQLQQIGIDAINRIGKLVNSGDEQVATKNAHYVVDHLKGKATNKSISVGVKASVQDLLR